MTREEVKELGFEEIPHYTVMGSMLYDLGRGRYLSFGCIGSPNEMIFLCQHDYEDHRIVTDLVSVHNYDYDGYIDKHKLLALMELLTCTRFKNKTNEAKNTKEEEETD